MESRLEEFNREEAYRIYVTQSLQLAPQSQYISKSYYEMMFEKQDNRSGDEIAAEVIINAGLRFGDERI